MQSSTPPSKSTKKIEEDLDDYVRFLLFFSLIFGFFFIDFFFQSDDRDSLEKAHLSSEDEEYSATAQRKVTSNRIVKKPLSRMIQEQPLKIKTTLR